MPCPAQPLAYPLAFQPPGFLSQEASTRPPCPLCQLEDSNSSTQCLEPRPASAASCGFNTHPHSLRSQRRPPVWQRNTVTHTKRSSCCSSADALSVREGFFSPRTCPRGRWQPVQVGDGWRVSRHGHRPALPGTQLTVDQLLGCLLAPAVCQAHSLS